MMGATAFREWTRHQLMSQNSRSVQALPLVPSRYRRSVRTGHLPPWMLLYSSCAGQRDRVESSVTAAVRDSEHGLESSVTAAVRDSEHGLESSVTVAVLTMFSKYYVKEKNV